LVRIGTQSLVIVSGDQGELRAFHNTCRHRGSVLCTEEAGNFARRRIVCPYHSWTYDLAGQLVATPRRMETPDFRREDFPLYRVATAAWAGFVFVNLSGDASLEMSELEQALKPYGLQSLRIGKRVVADVQANWKLIAENFSECFHCPPVHPELCRVVTAYRDAGAWGLRGTETKAEYAAGAQTLTLDGSARLPPISTLGEAERKILYLPAMLPPSLFLNVHPDYVNAHMMVPTGPESVRIVYDWLFEAERLPLSPAELEHYVALWDITNRQDARNCEWQQQGLQSREFKHGYYVPQEFDCHRFAQWVRAGLAPP
jgi:Rieske 2Fe-2S family protein